MTLTTPNCPAAGELPQMVENAVASVPGVGVVNVNLVWDPAWTPDRMSDEARLVRSELSGRGRIAADGGERGGQRSRRRRRQCQSGLGSRLDAGPDERRGAASPI